MLLQSIQTNYTTIDLKSVQYATPDPTCKETVQASKKHWNGEGPAGMVQPQQNCFPMEPYAALWDLQTAWRKGQHAKHIETLQMDQTKHLTNYVRSCKVISVWKTHCMQAGFKYVQLTCVSGKNNMHIIISVLSVIICKLKHLQATRHTIPWKNTLQQPSTAVHLQFINGTSKRSLLHWAKLPPFHPSSGEKALVQHLSWPSHNDLSTDGWMDVHSVISWKSWPSIVAITGMYIASTHPTRGFLELCHLCQSGSCRLEELLICSTRSQPLQCGELVESENICLFFGKQASESQTPGSWLPFACSAHVLLQDCWSQIFKIQTLKEWFLISRHQHSYRLRRLECHIKKMHHWSTRSE